MQRTYLLTEHLTSFYANTVHGQVLIEFLLQDPDIHIFYSRDSSKAQTPIYEKVTLGDAVSTPLDMTRSIMDPAAGMGSVLHVRMATTMMMMMANGTLTLIACHALFFSHARHNLILCVTFLRTIMRVRKRLLWPPNLSETCSV